MGNIRWTDGVLPWVFDATANEEDKKTILAAMAELEKHTCVRFPKRTNEPNYLTTIRDTPCTNENGGIAASYVGMSGGKQPLFVGPGCFFANETSHVAVWVHELMHALGVMHTQTRPDRDDYITVHEENIQPNHTSNYEKCDEPDCSTFNTSYNCQSVMHYRDFLFRKTEPEYQNKFTMTAKDPSTCNLKTGGYEVLQYDYDLIKAMYGCTDDSGDSVEPPPVGGPSDWDACIDNACGLDQGDCDSDDECAGDLVCGEDNCHKKHGSKAHKYADCCMLSDG